MSPSIFFLILTASMLLLTADFSILCMESITLWLFLLICSISSSFSANFLSALHAISMFSWSFLGLSRNFKYCSLYVMLYLLRLFLVVSYLASQSSVLTSFPALLSSFVFTFSPLCSIKSESFTSEENRQNRQTSGLVMFGSNTQTELVNNNVYLSRVAFSFYQGWRLSK